MRWQRYVVYVLILGGSAMGGVLALPHVSSWRTCRLEVSTESLDFGEAWAISDFRWKIRMRNTGARSMRVRGFQLGCQCDGYVEPKSAVIGPGETLDVTTVLDLARFGIDDKATQTASVSLTALCEAGRAWQEKWTVEGVVRPFLSPVAPSIDLPECIEGEEWPKRTVRLRSLIGATAIRILREPQFLHARIDAVDDRNIEFDMVLMPKAELPVGLLSGAVDLELVKREFG